MEARQNSLLSFCPNYHIVLISPVFCLQARSGQTKVNIDNIERRRQYSGPVFFKQGFRPFFLGACVWAAISLGIWIFALTGVLELPSAFAPVDWHIHELLFGYTGAVIAGFLLTAVPNWTGRYPISGLPLALLFATWLAGRLAVFFSLEMHPVLVAAVDLAFPLVLAIAIARELIAANSLRNLRVLMLLVIFMGANLFFHAEVWINGVSDIGARLGLSAVLLMIMLIGGRIIPSFTRNWLAKRGEGRLPVPFNRYDGLTMGFSAITFMAWSFWQDQWFVPVMLFAAGGLNAVRLWRWAGTRTWAEPLVIVLHIAFAFVPLGFFAMGVSLLFPDVIGHASAFHLWTAGAIGMMTMAVMTRASLGHTGQEMRAGWRISLIYLALFASVLLRFLAGYGYGYDGLIYSSALAWFLAYVGFALYYGPLFFKTPRAP